jgi:tetratricopeptide (TPR) repeat protein
MGQESRALAVARDAMDSGRAEYDLLNAAFALASRSGDHDLARRAMDLRLKNYPEHRASGYLQLGNLHATALKDSEQALKAFREAVELTPEADRAALREQIPRAFWTPLGLVPGGRKPHTSSSNG